jgi:hypothetical protein
MRARNCKAQRKLRTRQSERRRLLRRGNHKRKHSRPSTAIHWQMQHRGPRKKAKAATGKVYAEEGMSALPSRGVSMVGQEGSGVASAGDDASAAAQSEGNDAAQCAKKGCRTFGDSPRETGPGA